MPRDSAMPPDGVLLPPMLRPGDAVALVSPSGPAEPGRVRRGVELLTSWGLTVRADGAVPGRHWYFAGTDDQRRHALQAALDDPEIRAVICVRGGYGAQRVVDELDLSRLAADPKLVVGFSDITALQLALWRAARLASVHGPMAAWNDARTGERSARSLRDTLMTDRTVRLTRDPTAETGALLLSGAPVAGRLLGGNLSLLAASVGTPDLPDLRGAVLLLEEVAEAPYRVDRMLTQLLRAGALAGVVGVAVGQFTDCVDRYPTHVVEVLGERLGRLGVPVLGGLPVGHGTDQLSVPVGTRAVLDTAAGTLTVAAAVRPAGPGRPRPE